MATGANFPTNIHHVVFDVLRLKVMGNLINTVAFGNGREVDIQFRNALHQRIAFYRQLVDPRPVTALFQLGGARHFIRPPFRAKTPQVHQRPDGHVQRAVGHTVNTQRFQHHFRSGSRNRERFVHFPAGVKAAQLRIRLIGRHLIVDLHQPFVDLRLQRCQRRCSVPWEIADRVGRPHGFTLEVFLFRLTTGQ
ncbi:hypothetical protein D3C75_947340 [compost metagenome]